MSNSSGNELNVDHFHFPTFHGHPISRKHMAKEIDLTQNLIKEHFISLKNNMYQDKYPKTL